MNKIDITCGVIQATLVNKIESKRAETLMTMKSVESLRLLVILPNALGNTREGGVCRYLLLGLNISSFLLLDYVVY